MPAKKIQVSAVGVRPKFEEWIASRGGVTVWRPIDFSKRPTTFTPAHKQGGTDPYDKPHWAYGAQETVTDIERFEFVIPVEVARFRIALRMGSQGMRVKLTDGSTKKVNTAQEKATEKYGRGAFYDFDYSTQEAVIFIPTFEGEKIEDLLAKANDPRRAESARKKTYNLIKHGRACPECGIKFSHKSIGGGRCYACGSSIVAGTADECWESARVWLAKQPALDPAEES